VYKYNYWHIDIAQNTTLLIIRYGQNKNGTLLGAIFILREKDVDENPRVRSPLTGYL